MDLDGATMNRRALLAAAAGLGTVGAGGCLDGGSGGNEIDDADDADDGADGDGGPPYEIELIDAPGSEAGTVTVPQSGQVVLVNFTRQFCPTSIGYLSNVGEAYDRLASEYDVGPDGDVFVLSVIDWTQGATPSNEELADWWIENDGYWPIGIDRSGEFFDEYHNTDEFPGTAAIDGDGEVHWDDLGGTTPSNIVSGVRGAVEAESGVETESTAETDENDAAGETNETDADGRSDAD
ncbi:TlpA family protein disulfide reductase [Halosolutus halophilus]|uniref:TlpA family protein disulfide reductase n=1 Tax=Halosolutus halophilus TaxID=1552990 RepID=UPI002235216F|nr:TlpA family protein disulfide reductase [Halosolutus halophilus]